MVEVSPSPQVLRFGVFEVDLRAGELRKKGVRVKLQEQPFQILVRLLARPGEVITREELQQQLWPEGTFVDFEHALNVAVNRLRDALDDSPDNPRFVETLPRRGYRFIAPVEGAPLPSAERAKAAPGPGRWLALVAAVLVVVLLAILLGFDVGGLRRRLWGGVAPGEITSLAVLPLTNLAGDPEQEPFVDGMTEELITQLSRISALKRVISRQSAMQYRGTDKPLPTIARELGVEAVVEGSVLRVGERVRINVQLIQAEPERHLWSESYERELKDVLALQEEVTRDIAAQIKITLTPQEQAHLRRGGPVNPEAHVAYLRGRHFWNKRTDEGYARALASFQQAIAIEPSYALAYAGLADTYVLMVEPSPEETVRRARAAAQRALEIDDSLAEAHTALGFANAYEWNWVAAETEFHRALALNPNYATAHHWHGTFLTWMGRTQEAHAEFQRALELDPLSLIINVAIGFAYYQEERYDQAIQSFLDTLEMDPNFTRAHKGLALTYLEKGLWTEAVAEAEWVAAHNPNPEERANLAYAYIVSGRRAEGQEILRQLTRLDQSDWNRYGVPVQLARLNVALGDNAQALHWLEKAYDARSWRLTTVKVDRAFKPLHSDPRFQHLLRRMNLPE